MFLLMHKFQQFLNELFNDALRTSDVILAFEELYKVSDAKFLRCYVELFLWEGSYENPRENQVSGISFRSPTVSRA
jgi:hypothetical protein